MPYYAVQNGRKRGVYHDWSECKKQVDGFPGAVYKKFNNSAQASEFANGEGGYKGTYGSASAPSGGVGGATSRAARGSSGSSRDAAGSSANGKTSRDRDPVRVRSTSADTPAADQSGAPGTGEKLYIEKSIYVDGAARGNGKSSRPASGIGVFYGINDPRNAGLPMSQVDKGSGKAATNQRAELAALRHALRDVKREDDADVKYKIKTDSKYTMEAVTNWSKNWERNGWKTSTGQPVQNKDLIQECLDLYREINKSYAAKRWGNMKFEHVRGHQGIEGNEQADRLANLGADQDQWT